jgi:hypothetical protein
MSEISEPASVEPAPIDPGTAWSPPAPATVASAPASVAARSNRMRWLVAGLIVVVVAGLTLTAGVLLAGRSTPEALGYIPGDSAVVGELRLDLPGDQLQKVGNLLAHFPGFADQSTLPQKLDEAFTKLTTNASKGAVDYVKQIKPWIFGPTFAAGSPRTGSVAAHQKAVPGASDGTIGGGLSAADPGLIVATTDGTATCASVIGADQSPSTSTHQGVTILASSDGSRACALNGRIGVLGTLDTVKAALDAHAAHTGIDTSATYRTARNALGGDRLATIFVSKAALLASAGGQIPAASVLPLPSIDIAAAFAAIPDWAMGGISAENDAIVGDFVTAPVPAIASSSGTAASGSPLPTMPPARASRTAPLLPADTLALIDVHGAGISIRSALARLESTPALNGSLGQVDTTLAALGGADGLVGWIDDAAIAVIPDPTTAAGPTPGASGSSGTSGIAGATAGILLLASDDATATAKAAQLKSLISLAGLGGGQVQVHDETVGGATMTVVDLGDVSSLLHGLGAGASTVPIPAGTHLRLAFAAKGSAIIAGGEGFVRAVLGVQSGASLADDAGYKNVLAHASAEDLGEVYVSAASILTLADAQLPAATKAAFDTNTKPYLEPFDAIVVTTTLENGGAHVRLVATVK